MFDLNLLSRYKENNRLEAKTARGGLPKSVWETYSAFANTSGGIILLGVEEDATGQLHVVGVENPDKIIRDFWNTVNSPQKVSANLLTDKDVSVIDHEQKSIIAIEIPYATRNEKPVYLNGNVLSNSYRRNGDGDYRCTKEEVQSMLRDAASVSSDSKVLENYSLDILDEKSVRGYRMRMRDSHPNHVWLDLPDDRFLSRIGAAKRGQDGKLHPTVAGLLMFGQLPEITEEFPYYFLDYRFFDDSPTRWSDRICTEPGMGSGNIYDFFFAVYNKMAMALPVPFKLENGVRVTQTPCHVALREALANSLVHANYHIPQGVVITQTLTEITISNPGNFRIEMSAAIEGGSSDPRNTELFKMFMLLGICERAGSGIPTIFSAWGSQGWPAPNYKEQFSPDRVTLRLPIASTAQHNNADNRWYEIKGTIETLIKYESDAFKVLQEVMDKYSLTQDVATNYINKVINS